MMLELVSVEVSNPGEAESFACPAAGLETFIPWLPNSLPEEIVKAARALRRSGFRPVPHLAARRLKSETLAREMLGRLREECGVEKVLVIGGDLPRPVGPFASSLDLLDSGLLQASGIGAVGFGGYPEGHPSISDAELQAHLEAKIGRAKAKGLATFVVSQFCFDAAAIVQWLRRLRSRGIDAPVRIGLAGPASASRLLKLGLRCGLGNSLRLLRARPGGVARLATRYTPDDVLKDLAEPLPGEVALHLFAFGGIAATTQWLENFSLSTTQT